MDHLPILDEGASEGTEEVMIIEESEEEQTDGHEPLMDSLNARSSIQRTFGQTGETMKDVAITRTRPAPDNDMLESPEQERAETTSEEVIIIEEDEEEEDTSKSGLIATPAKVARWRCSTQT